jgi:hypothetical protein
MATHGRRMSLRFASLRTAADHRHANRALATLLRRAGARPARARVQEGLMRALVLPSHDLWLVQHALANRYRNAFGPGDPTGRGLVWPSVQLNVPLRPGGARPQARFVRGPDGALWVAHTGTLGGRQAGISRSGFIAFLAAAVQDTAVTIDERVESVLLLGTFARPTALLDAIADLVHGAFAYRNTLAAGFR